MVALILQVLFRFDATYSAASIQLQKRFCDVTANSGTKFLLILTWYGTPCLKQTAFHYKVQEQDQVKTIFVLMLTVLTAISCMAYRLFCKQMFSCY